jgi:hypothetical protein
MVLIVEEVHKRFERDDVYRGVLSALNLGFIDET